ncbi:MAG: class III signal peptide-containing protein [Elusimicrobia bacterium]|nr:class III signal peptide-containing protein [Elusimicrobiota bacterium]
MKRMSELMKDRRGQGTVEYLLMMSVIVGVVLVAGIAMKKFMPGMFAHIQDLIMGAINNLAG